MKRIYSLLSAFMITLSIQAQTADERANSLIGQGDFFELNRVYPVVKDSLSDYMQSFAGALVYTFFNRPQEALVELYELLNHHQDELGFDNSVSMVMLMAENQAALGNYAEAAQSLSNLLSQAAAYLDEPTRKHFESSYRKYDALAKFSPMQVDRPDRDCEFPLYTEGGLMHVPVVIKGREVQFVYDTGAGVNFVYESFAEEYGIHPVADSINVTGMVGLVYGKLGMADSIRLGEITIRNVPFVIFPETPEDSFMHKKFEAVVGFGIMQSLGEARLYPRDNKIIFPAKESHLPATGCNIFIRSANPFMEVISQGERMTMSLDTGYASDMLTAAYYNTHQNEVEAKGTPDSIGRSGIGGVVRLLSYKLPYVPLTIGDTPCDLTDISVNTQPIGIGGGMGILGCPFFSRFEEIVINFNKLFIKVQSPHDVFHFDHSYYIEPWKGAAIFDSTQSVAWYVHLQKGDYHLFMDMGLEDSQEEVECKMTFTVSPVEGQEFEPVSKQIVLKEKGIHHHSMEQIRIPYGAFYKVEVKGEKVKGSGMVNTSLRFETPTGKGGKARTAKTGTSPFVQLDYLPGEKKETEFEWLYGEIVVPEGYDPALTTYTAIGFHQGHLNLKIDSDTVRGIQFVVKESVQGNIQLLAQNDKAQTSEWEDGKGMQSWLPYMWATGKPVKFLLNACKQPGNFMVYTAWFMDNEAEGWKYVATWKAPGEAGYFKDCSSSICNFDRGTGQMVRRASFNTWGRPTGRKKWINFNKAALTHTDGESDSRSDYAGGVDESNLATFYISSGGFTSPVDSGKVMELKKSGTSPKIDIKALSSTVDKALR